MREFKGKNLTDRLQNSRFAKQALLEKAKQAPRIDDPEVVARRAAKLANAIERKAQRAEREAAKAAAAREQAEQEAREKAERAALAEQTAREQVVRQAALEAEQKAARDSRYAARKQRKG